MLQATTSYDRITVPAHGERVSYDEETGELSVPDTPIIPIIHGDGIGKDVGPAAQQVLDAAAEASGHSIAWMPLYAHERVRGVGRRPYRGRNAIGRTR